MLLLRKKRCAVPAASALVAVGVYAVFTFYFFEFELRATLRARRAEELPPWVSPVESRAKNSRSIQSWNTSDSATLSVDPTAAAHADRRDRAESEGTKFASSDHFHRKGELLGDSASNVTGSQPSDTVYTIPATEKQSAVDLTAKGDCEWVNLTIRGPPYFLTVVFIVRIYEKDLSELKTLDVKHWLLYLRYAGVEHVYLYDLWYLPGESQREPLDVFVREGYLTYLDRHELNPYVRKKSQLPSYQHCINEFGKDSVWQAAIDIDEYPFSSEDTEPGFMYRYVKKFSEENTDVSEITMSNFLYLGEKDKSKELLFEMLWRHTHGPSNSLVKPIYKPADIKRAQVHRNVRHRGRSTTAPSSGLRINHYWGPRLQNWGPDTEEILTKTEEDRRIEPIVAAFKTCDKYVRKYL